ncbi:uncharacterized protein FIESC28_00972 [Fusarium coffeatum]|uniref:Nephrocystin 3-like N-terminal domain-containing protein n=1 Tax=Fusarium coffeatum TaxID=231269 RepID=A0A366SA79_9HYPO|nr:uncharacterized protein FIESC28_00972 [Fusarium coffeatum]RBR26189.1 hypothetical protein FIESC28_00972 [Fusarium coffeatum]
MSISERDQLLRRLCPGDRSESWHKHLERARIPESGQWILDNPKTKEWLHNNSPSLLWLHGPSATGKTFLCSRLIKYVQETKGYAVACVKFQQNHKQYNKVDFNHALASVLRQLVSQLPTTSIIWEQLKALDDTPYPDDDEFNQLLHLVASEFDKAFIFFDNANSVTEAALRDLMLSLNPSESDAVFRVMFAGRNACTGAFSMRPEVLEIISRASDKDLEMYIIELLRDVSGKDLSSGHDELIHNMVKLFDGRFLPIPAWSTESPTPELLASLDQLVTSCDGASVSDKIDVFCKEAIRQITTSQWKDMIFCILYHIIKASEAGYSFTIPMALEALSAWQISHDEKDFNNSEVLLGCRGLIYYSEEDKSMRIASPLLGDYLRRVIFDVEYDKRSIVGFMRYLSSDAFAQGACKSSTSLKERLDKNRYLWFAARRLSPSLTTATPDTFVDDFIRLSSRRGSIESYLQAAESWPYESAASYDELEEDQERWQCFTTGYGPLHLAAHVVAPKMLIDSLIASGEDLKARDDHGRTALHLAAEIDMENSTLQALVDAGSNVLAEDTMGNTPLSNAVVDGSLESVKILLANGADATVLDEDILEQCGQEKPEIAEYLRELGIDVPVENDSDMED